MGRPVSTTSRVRRLLAAAMTVGVTSLLLIAGGAHAATTRLPAGSQVNDDPSAGIDPTRSVNGEDPANADLAAGAVTAGAAAVPWAIFRQATSGADQVFVRSFAGGAWSTRGSGTVDGRSSASPDFSASLNFDQDEDGEAPAIDFAGAGRTTAWATWYEDTTGSGFAADNIFASRFDATAAQWVFAGQVRGNGGLGVQVPSLNVHTNQPAQNPSIAGGSTVAGNDPGPWITWQEADNGTDQIFVVRPIKLVTNTCPDGTTPSGGSPVGGFCWQLVGTERINNLDPSLNVDRTRSGIEPDIAFAGASDTVPWVVWSETGTSSVSGLLGNDLVFAAKGLNDNNADGKLHWQVVGAGTAGQTETLDNSATGGPCTAGASPSNGTAEAACAMNKDASDDASEPRIAAGTMDPTSATIPWITWTETVGGTHEIFVARLVSHDHFELANNGKPISKSTDPSTRPDITFAGNTPYVSWLASAGGGVEQEFLGHFVNASSPTFVRDNGPLSVTSSAVADVRTTVSSACTDTPLNSDGAACQGRALGTPFSLRTVGTSPRELLADAYQPAKPVTGKATKIGPKSATVHGTANPGGASVSVRFDYGPSTSYKRHTAFRLIGPSNDATKVSAALTGLPAGKTTHVRLEVRTDFAVLFGADRPFTSTHASRLTIGKARSVTRGTKVSVATKLTDATSKNPLGGRTVKLFARHSKTGHWVKVAAKTTTHKGRASVKERLHRFTEYEWRYAGNKSHRPAVSAVQSITVKQR